MKNSGKKRDPGKRTKKFVCTDHANNRHDMPKTKPEGKKNEAQREK